MHDHAERSSAVEVPCESERAKERENEGEREKEKKKTALSSSDHLYSRARGSRVRKERRYTRAPDPGVVGRARDARRGR